MTQLDNVLVHLVGLASITPYQSEELKELIQGIKTAEITAETLIAEHRESNGTFGSDWNLTDIAGVAEGELSDEEIRMVAETIERRHDAEIGINWQVIQDTIDFVVSKREE